MCIHTLFIPPASTWKGRWKTLLRSPPATAGLSPDLLPGSCQLIVRKMAIRNKKRILLFLIHWWIYFLLASVVLKDKYQIWAPGFNGGFLPRVFTSLKPGLLLYPLPRPFLLLKYRSTSGLTTPNAAHSSLPRGGLSRPPPNADINRLMSGTAESFQEWLPHWSAPCVILIATYKNHSSAEDIPTHILTPNYGYI